MFKEPLIQTIEMRALMIIWWVCSKKMWWSGSKVNLIFFLYSLLHSQFSSQAHSQWDFQLHALERAWGQEHCVQFLVNLKHSLREQCNRYLHSEQCTSSAPEALERVLQCNTKHWICTALRHLRIVADRKDHLIHQFGKHWKRKLIFRRRNKKVWCRLRVGCMSMQYHQSEMQC